MKALYLNVLVFFLVFPQFGEAQSLLSEAQLYFNDKNYKQAISVLKLYLQEGKRDEVALELLGDAYSYESQWDYAASQYGALVNLNPKNANYSYKYGGALAMRALSVNKITAISIIIEARDYFLKAASLDSKHIDVRWALVKIYTELPLILGGSFTKALNVAEELEALSKVDGYLAKGYIFETSNRFDLAESYYVKALHIGGSKTCYNMLSDYYLSQGKKEEAMRILKDAYTKWNDSQYLEKIKEIRI